MTLSSGLSLCHLLKKEENNGMSKNREVGRNGCPLPLSSNVIVESMLHEKYKIKYYMI